MKKNIIKILLIISMCACFSFLVVSPSVALTGEKLVDEFDGKLDTSVKTDVDKLTSNTINPVLSAIRIVAIGIAVVMITYLGVHYVSAAPSEKASIKNQLIALAVGVILIAIAPKVVEIVGDTATSIFN